MKMKNPYTATSVEVGDVMAYTIKFHVKLVDSDGTLLISVYKCPWEDPQYNDDGIPQGTPMVIKKECLVSIFPILSNYEFAIVM